MGFAVRIQSLPQGTEVGIKALAARFPEGEKLIAAALRELEAHGYLQRARTRLPNSRIVTRTVFCNQPTALLRPRAAAAPPQLPPAARPITTHAQASEPTVKPEASPEPDPQAGADARPARAPGRPTASRRPTLRTPRAAPDRAPTSRARPSPAPRARPELERISTALLSGLRHHAPQFTLSEEHVRELIPSGLART
ncbi:DNA-binding protein OS=Streptomyces microflavus OX=1919 GN=G3I39_28610 PE=4 SV=1 [Streptomyces microflavus]